ncbi:hypothetical protein [Sphingomonas aquatilis]
MPVRIQMAPPEVSEALEVALVELHDARVEDGLELAAPVSTTPPFPLLTVQGAQVAEGNWLGGLLHVGWRSVVEFADGSFGLADVVPEGERLMLASLSRGARTEALLKAAHSLDDGEELPDVNLAVLWAPEVRLSALELRGEGLHAFLPFEGMPARFYLVEEFLVASRDYARGFRDGVIGEWTEDEFEGQDSNGDGGSDDEG